MNHRKNSQRTLVRVSRNGLSLMEVIVAIAILGGAMAVISNMVFLGTRASIKARWMSEAQILCDSKMAEISAGVVELSSVSSAQFEASPEWMYSILVEAADIPGLMKVTVIVQPDSVSAAQQTFALQRFLPDPNYEPAEAEIQ